MWRVVKAYLLYTWGGLHRYFGNQNSIQHEFRRAIYYFGRAYEVNPAMQSARLARATILWRELEDVEEALAELDAMLTIDPDYGEARFNRALARQEAGQYEGALEDLDAYLARHGGEDYAPSARRMRTLLQELLQDS